MSHTKMKENTECHTGTHGKHLCHLMHDGFHLSSPHEYKELVQNAQYRCQNCGRTAHSSEDLCEPIEI